LNNKKVLKYNKKEYNKRNNKKLFEYKLFYLNLKNIKEIFQGIFILN